VARGSFRTVLRAVERSALALGMAAALVVVAAVGSRWVAQGEARSFASEGTVVQADVREWNPNRVRAWRDALKHLGPAPLATLRIRRLGVNVVVLAGTDDWTLNRAVGHIEGTAKPGDDGNGNVALAGHRDGFFRPLKDISAGDIIELATGERVDRYRVTQTLIVAPSDVWVLDPTESPTLTLVTCYPFYFIGSAPKRFIVRAAREDVTPTRLSTR
jgi:sortase A